MTMTNPLRMTPRTMRIAGHRGHSTGAPENTLAAFRKAHELAGGHVVCETDIALTSDGEMILMHDDTIDRTTNGKGLVRNMTYAEIAALDAGSWYDISFAGERVPLLKEALQLGLELCITFQVELKIFDQNDKLFPKLRALIDEMNCARIMQFASFDFVQLKALKKLIPEVPTMGIGHSRLIDPVSPAKEAGVDAINIELQHFPSGEVHQLHAAGIAVSLYVPGTYQHLETYGVDTETRIVGWVRDGLLDQLISDDIAYVVRIWKKAIRDL